MGKVGCQVQEPIHGGQKREWRLLDVSATPLTGEAGLPFAIEEQECERVGAGAPPLLHIWRHQRALILGLRDRKLPFAEQAMADFRQDGWSVTVRSSGGAAVPLDDGVVNVSMVLPGRIGMANLHEDFAAMARLIRAAVQQLSASSDVRTGEIEGAYCPGEYDLSIGGVKFCGIAQRRRLGAYTVQAFVVVEGLGAVRAAAADRFYTLASGGRDMPSALKVTPHSTQSLQQLLGSGITVASFVNAIKQVQLGDTRPISEAITYNDYDEQRLNELIHAMQIKYDTTK